MARREEETALDRGGSRWTTPISGLPVFPWAHFGTAKRGGARCTRCSTCGATFRFRSSLGGQAARRSSPRYAGLPVKPAIYVKDRGYVDLPAFMCCAKHWLAFFGTACQVERIDAHRVCWSALDEIALTGIRQSRPSPWSGFDTRQDYPALLRRPLQGPRVRQHDGRQPTTARFRPPPICAALPRSRRWRWTSLQWIKQHLRIAVLRHYRRRGEDQIWIAVSVYVLVAIVKKRHRPGRLALHFVTDPPGDPLRENAHTSSTCGRRKMQRFGKSQPIRIYRFLGTLGGQVLNCD